MTQTFQFKPALLAPTLTLSIEDQGFILQKGDEVTHLPFEALQSVRFWALTAQRRDFFGLDMAGRDGQKIDLRMSVSQYRSDHDPDRLAYAAMLKAVLGALASARTDILVEIGQKTWVKWILFLLGALLVVFSVAMPVLGILDGRASRLWDASVPIAVMFIFGATLCWSFRPGQPVTRVAPEHLLKAL